MPRQRYKSTSLPFCCETTPPGRGGISVVEILGPGAWHAVKDLIVGRTFPKPPRIALVNLTDHGSHIDECIIAFAERERSSRGTETVEVNLHGGPICVKRLIRALAKRGIQQRSIRYFNEFVARCRKFDALQSEAHRLLPSAMTLRAAAMLSAQQDGALSREISGIIAALHAARGQLRALLTGNVKAQRRSHPLEFRVAQQPTHFLRERSRGKKPLSLREKGRDKNPLSLREKVECENSLSLRERERGEGSKRMNLSSAPPANQTRTFHEHPGREKVREALDRLDRLIRAAPCGIALASPRQCVIAGEPNAGKSSLFNALLGRQRAIVHHEAGTTRDFIEAVGSFDGVPFRLVDTAGISADPEQSTGATDEIQEIAQTQSRSLMRKANVILWVVDAPALLGGTADTTGGGAGGVFLSLESLPVRRNAAIILVINKIDLLLPDRVREVSRHVLDLWSRSGVTCTAHVATSALTGEGVETLRAAIVRCLTGVREMPSPVSPQIFTQKQLGVLIRVRHAVGEADAMWEVEGRRACSALAKAIELLEGATKGWRL